MVLPRSDRASPGHKRPESMAACTAAEKKPPRMMAEVSERTLPAGAVRGFVGQYGSNVYLGLPYAEPPVGPLRWRAPSPAKPWEGVREALKNASPCPQFGSPFAGIDIPSDEIAGSEDYLYLNVYAPVGAGCDGDQDRRPVLVWIHGGGNTVGEAAFYDGGYLAASRDVVVVAINYRLGPLGWFRHASLRQVGTSAEDRSGNFGILDMIEALRWVRDNVAAFGGNPDNVTIFGESAGGTDVLALLRAPGAKDLFHRAISQSGNIRTVNVSRAENFVDDPVPGLATSSNEILLLLLTRDGLASDRASAKSRLASMSSEQVATYLRSKSAEEILRAYLDEDAEGGQSVPKVFAEGWVLPAEFPIDTFARASSHAGVPVMLGTNRDESKLFLAFDPEHTWNFLGIVPRLRDPDRFAATAEHGSRLWKASGADEPAAALLSSGLEDVYVYRFDWDEEPSVWGVDLAELAGAAHGFEIPFVFGHFDIGDEGNMIFTEKNEPARRKLSEQMISYWVNFAKTGQPGRGLRGDLPEWEPAPAFMLLDTEADGGPRMSQDTVTEEDVLAAVLVDDRLGDQSERCEAHAEARRRSVRNRDAPAPAVCRATKP